ncbi:MAG: hypothetical protein IKL36_05200 [Clostridia bacterium]|nr:hypothetical protein [Clostridia bacterium]
MNITGKWMIKKALFPTEEAMNFFTREEAEAAGISDTDELEVFCTAIEIKENGELDTYMQMPKRRFKVDSTTWCEKDGEYFYQLDGEDTPLRLREDGLLEFCMGMMLMERQ